MYHYPPTPPSPPAEPSPTTTIQVTIGGECNCMDGAVGRNGQVGDPVLYQFYTEVMGYSHQDVMEYHGYYNTNVAADDDDDYDDEDYDDAECEPLFSMLTVTMDHLKGFVRLFNVDESSVSVHVETSYDSGPTRAYIQGLCTKTEDELELERRKLRAQHEKELKKYQAKLAAYEAQTTKRSLTS